MIYIGLGSNLGRREENLLRATTLISTMIAEIELASSIIETEPWGNQDQPSFLNQVIGISTNLTPSELLERLQAIELIMGRERKEKWGPRTIDLDILFYRDEVIEEPSLTIPHPFIEKRDFVLQPLYEISPYFVHPVSGQTIEEMYLNLSEEHEQSTS